MSNVTINKPTPNFSQAGCLSCCPTNSVKHWTESIDIVKHNTFFSLASFQDDLRMPAPECQTILDLLRHEMMWQSELGKMCKAPVRLPYHHQHTNIQPFYWLCALPATPGDSAKHWRVVDRRESQHDICCVQSIGQCCCSAGLIVPVRWTLSTLPLNRWRSTWLSTTTTCSLLTINVCALCFCLFVYLFHTPDGSIK